MATTLNDTRTDGVASESGGIVNVELLHEMLAMFFNGFTWQCSWYEQLVSK
jgi:hypothetical protein